MTLGETVRTCRESDDLTQEELGNLVGASRQTIIAIEKGKTTPGFSLAKKLADELRFSLDYVTLA